MDTNEANVFVAQPALELDKIDTNVSQKTNFFISGKNFISMQVYLIKLKDYSVYLSSLINLTGIINDIFNKIQTDKLVLTVITSLNINQIEEQTVNNVVYQIKRIDDYIIEITNSTVQNWIVDSLIIDIKDNDGTKVYPRITTKNNKITIYFIDGILTNYKVIIL